MKLLFENWRRYLNESVPLSIKVGGAPLKVEVVSDEKSINKGLMFRKELEPDSGMLFVFSQAAPRSFWMKNTDIPLSIAYINEDNKILNIEDMIPHDTNGVNSEGKAKCAIETNKGWFESNGVKPGDYVEGITF